MCPHTTGYIFLEHVRASISPPLFFSCHLEAALLILIFFIIIILGSFLSRGAVLQDISGGNVCVCVCDK